MAKISWTGKSSNSLTGVSATSAPVGALVMAFPGADTGYSGEASITAKDADGNSLALKTVKISGSQWVNGVATIIDSATQDPVVDGIMMDVTVMETSLSPPSLGRTGSDKAQLKIKRGYFLVEIPTGLALNTLFPMRVTAFKVDDTKDTGYNTACSISSDGSGDLFVNSIATGDWSSGIFNISLANNQKYYNSSESNKTIKITVVSNDGITTGFANTMLNIPAAITPAYDGGWEQYGMDPHFGEAAWNQAFANCVNSTPSQVTGLNIVGQFLETYTGSSADIRKRRKTLIFDVSSVKATAQYVNLYIHSAARYYTDYNSGGPNVITTVDSIIEIYYLAWATPSSVPDWKGWQSASLLGSYLRSSLVPDALGATGYAILLSVPAEILKSLPSNYFTLIIVDADEKVDAMLPYPGGTVSNVQNRMLILTINDAKLYVQ
jgi:hypothetical protein